MIHYASNYSFCFGCFACLIHPYKYLPIINGQQYNSLDCPVFLPQQKHTNKNAGRTAHYHTGSASAFMIIYFRISQHISQPPIH
jgi:hypothetical protein